MLSQNTEGCSLAPHRGVTEVPAYGEPGYYSNPMQFFIIGWMVFISCLNSVASSHIAMAWPVGGS